MTAKDMPPIYAFRPKGVQRIKINNVVRWMDENRHEFNRIVEEMKLVPPFDHMVICWKRESLGFRICVATYMLEDGEQYEFIDKYYPDHADDIKDATDGNIRWVAQAVQQIAPRIDSPDEDFYTTSYSTVYYDDKGFAYPISTGAVEENVSDLIEAFGEGIDVFMFNDMLQPLFATCAFMHCRNVEIIDEPLTRQQSRFKKRQKKKGRDVTYFNILDLYPFRRQIVKDGDSISTGVKRAMHMVRGHFATYTEEAPLFGHTVGSVWKPAHARGHQSEGKIVSDYEIHVDENNE